MIKVGFFGISKILILSIELEIEDGSFFLQQIIPNISNTRFDKITGTPNVPTSYGIRLSENFPNIDENNDGNIIEITVNETKNIVTTPTRLEIFDMK